MNIIYLLAARPGVLPARPAIALIAQARLVLSADADVNVMCDNGKNVWFTR